MSDVSKPYDKSRKTVGQEEKGSGMPRLPHEHDESHDSQESGPRKIIRQAYDDVQSGKEDTDLRSTRGRRVRTVPRNR